MSSPTTTHKAAVVLPTIQLQQTENQRRAAELREKLLAQRQQQKCSPEASAKASTVDPLITSPKNTSHDAIKPEHEEGSPVAQDPFGVQALLDQGKAAAHAKSNSLMPPPPVGPTKHESIVPVFALPPVNHSSTRAAQSAGMENPFQSTNNHDAGDPDLKLWLDITGYYDFAYRTKKLANHKEREKLEQEAARIAERLQALREDGPKPEAPTTPAKQNTAMPAAVAPRQAPSSITDQLVPRTMPIRKRLRSPEPAQPAKARRNAEQRPPPRGPRADSPMRTARGRLARNPTPPPGSLERRISYPDARRRSPDWRAKDRTNYQDDYHQQESYADAREYDQYVPRYPAPRANQYEDAERLRYSSVNNQRDEYGEYGDRYGDANARELFRNGRHAWR